MGVDVNLFGQDHVLVTFQLRQQTFTNLILCNTTLALVNMTCSNLRPIYIADQGTNNSQVIATGGNLYAVAYTTVSLASVLPQSCLSFAPVCHSLVSVLPQSCLCLAPILPQS